MVSKSDALILRPVLGGKPYRMLSRTGIPPKPRRPEMRRLVLVPRESPLTAAHLEQMARLARQGVTILPPDPAWYTRPKSLDDFIDQVAMKICDHLGIPADVERRWGK